MHWPVAAFLAVVVGGAVQLAADEPNLPLPTAHLVCGALEKFPESLRHSPVWPRALVRLAWILATHPDPRVRDPAAAAEILKRSGRADSPQAADRDTAAAVAAAGGDFQRAAELARLAAAASATEEERARRLRRAELYSQGLPAYDAALAPIEAKAEQSAVGPATAWYLLGQWAQSVEQPRVALFSFLAAVELDAEYRAAHLALGRLGWELRALPRALEHAHQAAMLDTTDPEALALLGVLFSRVNQRKNAIQVYRRLVSLRPDLHTVANDLAWLLATHPDAAARHGPEAVRWAEQACRASGFADWGMLDTLAAAYAETGDFDRAIATVDKALAVAPAEHRPLLRDRRALYALKAPCRGDFRMYLRLADAALHGGRLGEAERLLTAALQLRPDDAAATAALGRLRRLQQRPGEAIALYRRALATDPTALAVANDLAWLLATSADASLRNGEEAVALAQQVCGASNRRPSAALDTLAAALAEAGRHDQAVEVMRIALSATSQRLPADQRQAMQARLRLYEAGQAYHEPPAEPAVDGRSQMPALEPAALAEVRRGWQHRQQGEYAQAIACYRAALARQPDHPLIANDLAWLLATVDDPALRDGRAAMALARRACAAVNRPTAALLDTLAAAHAELGQFDEAVRLVEEAERLARGQDDGAAQAADLAARRRLYLQKRPYRMPRSEGAGAAVR